MSLIDKMFPSELDSFKCELKHLLSSKGEFKRVNREKAKSLVKAIEDIQQENVDLKGKLYQIKEIVKSD
ncbi:hypothetical protein [Paenibacillus sp. P46E]|uniref:hypothetical protein n=1 Tax=Paenibacillus sp. P46E TaxID=1349436 RepID=UPI00093EF4FA|nr:hypothetical protein [Paenibacillus sp. P46E]OKP95179.1 hypothetical protein A3849_26700 [Paenibacillus sp. P46E]